MENPEPFCVHAESRKCSQFDVSLNDASRMGSFERIGDLDAEWGRSLSLCSSGSSALRYPMVMSSLESLFGVRLVNSRFLQAGGAIV
jgi:hypothetical protein